MLKKIQKLFSQKVKPNKLPNIEDDFRTKVWLVLCDLNTGFDGGLHFGHSPSIQLLSYVMDYLLRAYGGKLYSGKSKSEEPIVQHFYSCPTEQFLDLLEVIFLL